MKIEAAGGFGIVSKKVMADPRVSIQAKCLYASLATYADAKTRETWVSVDRLAGELGVSTRSVKAWMADLVEAGVIERSRPGAKGRRSATSTLRDWVRVKDE